VKFNNISSNEKVNEWINESYQECKASYPLPGKGRIAFDIGANVGGFCIHAHKNFDKIFAFEPVLENYNILCQMLEQMNIKNVEAYNTAIFSQSGLKLSMKTHVGNEKSDKLISGDVTCVGGLDDNYKNIDQLCETVSLKDAMDALGLDQLDYLKLDCEGSEYAILENYNNYENIKYICMEIHQFYGYDRKKKLLKMLEKFYYLTDINKNGSFSASDIIQKQIVDNFEKYDNVLMINKSLFNGVKK
jgi:FkbM family methyltransferase